MAEFNYEWWTVEIKYACGTMTTEFKGKSKDHVIKQIERFVKKSNSEKEQSKPIWFRPNLVIEVHWDTLKLDRIGYQRLN